jgi:Transposase DDE domain group 1
LHPDSPAQRRYEALRGYLADGLSAAEAAARFGYTPASLLSAVRDFRARGREFFLTGRPGPKTAPAKDAARPGIMELRAAGHSIDEIAAALAADGTPLNRTGIAEVIAAEGLPRLWRRPDTERGGPAREIQARAQTLDFAVLPERAETRLAGLLLIIPDLIGLGLPDMVAAAGYPSTPKIPALAYLLSLLALKLTGTRRVSHVYDIAADPGAALFAGLTALPKATALTSYSYRLQHSRQAAFLAGLDKAVLAAGLADGEALNLDFHAVMHCGEDPVLEKHYVPRRSQRTRSVLTFFAEDAATHTLLYANADLSKATQNREVIAFADHWHHLTGNDPALLIFDSKLTTQAVLAELDDRGIGFITLRARHPAITKTLAALPANAWTSLTLERAGGRTRHVRVHDDPAAQLSAYPRPIRQLAVTGLGHDQPTLLITNRTQLPARQIIWAYARRMNIEQRLAEAIQSFSLDALASAVPLNVDLDVVLSVLAHTLCAALRRRLPGYHTATPDTLQRRFLNTGGTINNHGNQITIRINGAPTHPSCDKPPCPKPSPSPGGKAAPSATNTPNPSTGGRFA